METIYRIVRKKNRKPIGVLAAVAPDKIGYSYCNKKDQFNREHGKMIALNRAINGFNTKVPRELEVPMMRLAIDAKRYF